MNGVMYEPASWLTGPLCFLTQEASGAHSSSLSSLASRKGRLEGWRMKWRAIGHSCIWASNDGQERQMRKDWRGFYPCRTVPSFPLRVNFQGFFFPPQVSLSLILLFKFSGFSSFGDDLSKKRSSARVCLSDEKKKRGNMICRAQMRVIQVLVIY